MIKIRLTEVPVVGTVTPQCTTWSNFSVATNYDGHCGRDYDPPMPIEPEREAVVNLTYSKADGHRGRDFDPPVLTY